jgi:translation initiation factor IF-3
VIKSKAKSTQVTVEIRFGPQTDEHDYEFKRKNAEKFLKEGAKLKLLFLKVVLLFIKIRSNLIIKISNRSRGFGKVEGCQFLKERE